MIPGIVIVTRVTAKGKLIQCVRTKKRNPDSESHSDKSVGKRGICKILQRGGDQKWRHRFTCKRYFLPFEKWIAKKKGMENI